MCLLQASERGIGSRIMAALGYMAGRGLGRGGAGIVAPIQVQAQHEPAMLPRCTVLFHEASWSAEG